MKDGYYLSAYLNINVLAYLYNISLRHDQTVALWKLKGSDVELIRYWELERKTGIKKHSLSFFSVEQCQNVINELLAEVSLSLDDIHEIWGTPRLEKNGMPVTSYDESNPCPYHTICHLFSGIASDTEAMKNVPSLALAIDGGPDNVVDRNARRKSFYWGLYVNGGKMSFFQIPSPGAFWSLLRVKTGMEEGALMALGSATRSRCPIEDALVLKAPLVVNGEDFNEADRWIDTVLSETQAIHLSEIEEYDNRFDELENRVSMAVKIVQEASKNILHNIIKKAIHAYSILPYRTRLVVTGGFALNCPTNSYLMKTFGFSSFDTCPCVSDSGIALGIGLYEFYKRQPDFTFRLKNAYHGSKEEKDHLFFYGTEWASFVKSVSPFQGETFAQDLLTDIVIWFDGQAEIGPRALGARSILGDPRNIEVKNRINNIKQRQWWRPVAPIILEREQNEWFRDDFYSPYMLCTCYAQEGCLSRMMAILHLDHSARIQTMRSDSSTLLLVGMKAFYKKSGIPIVCNTSLNDKGEPIVDTFEQCLNFALRKGIHIVYLNGYRYQLYNHNSYTTTLPHPRHSDWFDMNDDVKSRYKALYNPGGFSSTELDIYLNMPELSDLCLQEDNDIIRLRRILHRWKRLSKSVWAAILL